MNLEQKKEDFLKDYNAKIEELNDELSGIEDMPLNKIAKKIEDVEVLNIVTCNYLIDTYLSIKKHK